MLTLRHAAALLLISMTVPSSSSGAATAQALSPAMTYPETKRVDQVDEQFGVKVADPYRWLENDVRTDKAVADWVESENKVTQKYLEAIPEREAIRQRITAIYDYEKYSAPFKVGGRYFFSKNDGLQNQSVLYVQESLDATRLWFAVLIQQQQITTGRICIMGISATSILGRRQTVIARILQEKRIACFNNTSQAVVHHRIGCVVHHHFHRGRGQSSELALQYRQIRIVGDRHAGQHGWIKQHLRLGIHRRRLQLVSRNHEAAPSTL